MTPLNLLWTIQLAPLAAFLLIFLTPKAARRATAPAVGVGGALVAALSSLSLLWSFRHEHAFLQEFKTAWLTVADYPLMAGIPVNSYKLSVGFLLDPLNLLMISVVTVIAFFVQVFSAYYMDEDPSRARYFAFLSFFTFAMTGLVLAGNLLQTFLFWELVGLASYLLIGFYYEKPAAGTAARKAFVLNRLADLGFYLGIILLFLYMGTLDFPALQTEAVRAALGPISAAVGILVFMGVMGKSAQFPFHVWLPDAMEGPTPVSALIHSATMVAAGVFLLARAFGLFSAAEFTLQFALIAGALTALTGALLATVQRDIKRILAYSTVSQLGLMVMGIGAGAPAAGMFHLSTHACFKSLLFLTSGAFIHTFHSNDIWEIARAGGKKEKLSMAALAFGLLSLCGIPPFAGFFSKDMLLEALHHHAPLFYWIAVAVSVVTVYYSFRMFFVLLFSKEKKAHAHPHENHGHGAHGHHGSPLLDFCKALPLVSLALISLFVGALGTQAFDFALLHWLGGHDAPVDMKLAGMMLALSALAAGTAFWFFRDPDAAEARLESPRGGFKHVLQNKFYVDDAYDYLVKQIGLGVAAGMQWFDKKIVNSILVDRTSKEILDFGKLASRLQGGLLQDYLAFAIGAGVLIVIFVLKG